MTLYEKVQKYLLSEGWKVTPQYTKSGDLIKHSPIVMSKINKSNKASFVVTITKRNTIHPAIYRQIKDEIQRINLESMHINEFLIRGVSGVFKVDNNKIIH